MEKGHRIPVLDRGYVTFIDCMGTDEGIVEAARMSTNKGFQGWEDREECTQCGLDRAAASTNLSDGHAGEHVFKKVPGDKNLIDFLWRKKHATPFEMCELQIEVAAPIFVFREWHRHRTQSYNEFSARYSVMPNEHYVPELSRFMPKMSANKQEASTGRFNPVLDGPDNHRARVAEEQEAVYKFYDELINAGVPKEVARINTPVSRYSKMRAKTDLRSWLMFCNLRMRPDAQFEIRQYAQAVGDIIKAVWPRVWELFEEYDLYGAHLGRTELLVLRELMELTGIGEESLTRSMLARGQSETKAKEFVAKMMNGGSKILS